ncbi:hypothetical protein [Flavobacterium macacae]|uniref:C1q domain-containing protein n=1 Tax=Flavobacterium macacae TaxID=2488993 RepID=A0A3P3W7Q9_9FLAO|nr:hypothetical protein [Flavobacterium macacae]RRJ90488.1 hypothetical protein EG849_10665 [Flavobacterium macacae]
MRKIFLPSVLLFHVICFSQIGIETAQPTAMLDINGNMRIRNIPSISRESVAKDSILTSNITGNSHRVSSKTVVYSHKKSYVAGFFAGGESPSLSLTSSRAKIPFNAKEIDLNNDFNVLTNTFTAPHSGIYRIGVQIVSTSAVGVTTDFGVQIVKNGTAILARSSFANIGVVVLFVNINVTQPLRNLSTTVSLNAGETITFETKSALLNISLLGNNDENFFFIYQLQ